MYHILFSKFRNTTLLQKNCMIVDSLSIRLSFQIFLQMKLFLVGVSQIELINCQVAVHNDE